MLIDAVMITVLLVLLFSSIAVVLWMIRNDENFRMWMNMAYVRYYNRAEKLHERLRKLPEKMMPLK